MNEQRRKSLRRLPPEFYQGQAYVHWSLTMQDRKTGWLTPVFYYKYRELLTHTAFRFGLCCPIYCCMPDHIHMLWVGIHQVTDQRLAMRYFQTLFLKQCSRSFNTNLTTMYCARVNASAMLLKMWQSTLRAIPNGGTSRWLCKLPLHRMPRSGVSRTETLRNWVLGELLENLFASLRARSASQTTQ